MTSLQPAPAARRRTTRFVQSAHDKDGRVSLAARASACTASDRNHGPAAAHELLAEEAHKAGLRLISIESLVIRRRRCGRGYIYLDERNQRITDTQTLARFRQLAVPPAYKDVRLTSDPQAHLQAVGSDKAGRLQYRYHPDWEAIREATKADRLAALCAVLPRLRRYIARDLRRDGLGRDRVMAGIVTLIDRTHIRIGCEDYVHSGRSRGAATLLKRSVVVEAEAVQLTFRGKGGKMMCCIVRAPALARLVAELKDSKGQRLFCFRTDDGKLRQATAGGVNDYLRQIAGAAVTAKDFRTLAATAEAAKRLAELEPAGSVTGRRRQLAVIFRDIAAMLGNTPAVTRKSYVHRKLVEAFQSGKLSALAKKSRRHPQLSAGEAIVASLFASNGRDTGRPSVST